MSTCHNVIHGTAFCFSFLCCSGTLSDTTHSLCYRILFSKLAVQHFNRAYGIRHMAYSEDNGTKVMAFPLHCSNEKESYTLSCFKSTTCSKNDYKNLQLWHLLIMVTETLLVKWTNFLLLFNRVWVSEPLLQDSLAWLSLVALRIHRLP
jgi:hypothetical protein